jgi:sigma-B regulation protein RsbU (phosphoserine phosphatase)
VNVDQIAPPRAAPLSGTDFKALYRKLERTLDEIEGMSSVSDVLSVILESLVHDYEEELGIHGGRLYKVEDRHLVLRSIAGKHGAGIPDEYRIPLDYPPVRKVLSEELIIMENGDSGFDESIEGPIGVTRFAAIAIGEEATHVMSFSIREETSEIQVLYSLNAVRHVINLKLRQERLTDTMSESRRIQESLLPAGPPSFAGYDIDGLSRPTEFVGGDLFDYLQLSTTLLGVAIADASGHGLPAALLARDVITGLRVGMAADLKIIKTIEKLNRVIHRSALSSKFVSLFYVELEPNGNFIYTNAGHTPPLLLRGETFEELRQGGLVLGPAADAQYERGYVRLCPGDTVVMYTDGISECEDPSGNEFGIGRLREVIHAMAGCTSREMVEGIFEATRIFSRGAHQRDDMTVVVIRKT